LNRNGDQRRILALFLIKFFDVLGYRPDLSTCQICSTRPAASEPVSFAVQSGGVICTPCSRASRNEYRSLAAGTVQMISAVQQQPIARLGRFKPGGMVLEQILDYAGSYGRHLFQREIQSWKWLDHRPGGRMNQSR
jgi:DNA repair protein RecO (recombination protein O)